MTEDEEFEALEQRLNYKPKEQAMNREDIIRMAREAGLFVHKEVQPELERFAALVAAAEREACAKVCDGLWQDDGTAYDCREAIRARGQA